MCYNISRFPHLIFQSGSKHPSFHTASTISVSLHFGGIKGNLKKMSCVRSWIKTVQTTLEPDYDHFYVNSLTGDSNKNEIGLNVHTGHLPTSILISHPLSQLLCATTERSLRSCPTDLRSLRRGMKSSPLLRLFFWRCDWLMPLHGHADIQGQPPQHRGYRTPFSQLEIHVVFAQNALKTKTNPEQVFLSGNTVAVFVSRRPTVWLWIVDSNTTRVSLSVVSC